MIGDVRRQPVEDVLAGVERLGRVARGADEELTLVLAYAHRVMSPPLSLRVLSQRCGLSPSTIRARVHAPGVLDEVRALIAAGAADDRSEAGDDDAAGRCSYRVHWSSEDGEYVGTVEEFPSLSWLSPDPDVAFAGVRALVEDVLAGMAGQGGEGVSPGAG